MGTFVKNLKQEWEMMGHWYIMLGGALILSMLIIFLGGR